MNIKAEKIKAFSLQEMMVVLIITSIILGMAFAVLNLVQRQMEGIETIYAVKTDVNRIRQSLWIDFNRYSYILYDQKRKELRFSNEMGEKTYMLTNGNLFINENTQVPFESIEFYFDNQAVVHGEVDAISVKTSKETGHQEIFVFKENTPETYINQYQ